MNYSSPVSESVSTASMTIRGTNIHHMLYKISWFWNSQSHLRL